MRGIPVLVALLAASLLPATGRAAAIRDIRIAFEREKDHLFVREMIAIVPDADRADKPESVVIPLAEGARRVQLSEMSESEGIALKGNAVSVERIIPEEGLTVGVMFHLPILDGAQRLGPRDEPRPGRARERHGRGGYRTH